MIQCLAQGHHKYHDRDSNPHASAGNTRAWVQWTRPLCNNTAIFCLLMTPTAHWSKCSERAKQLYVSATTEQKCQFDTALKLIQWLNCKTVSTQVWRLGMRANQFLKNTRWIFQIGVRRANVKQILCFSIFKISSVKIHIERGEGLLECKIGLGFLSVLFSNAHPVIVRDD
jgi:hypothetical protein